MFPQGILQPDMWNITPSDRWDWYSLREMISKNGVRNSLLIAPMPTASTSQILGNNECFEPYTSNIYSRRVLRYALNILFFVHFSKHQSTFDLRTVWEIKQRTLVDMAVDRGCYIDQSQSLNIHMDQPNFGKLTSLHFYAWSKGLKTGMYYLRTRAAADAIKFTVDTSLLQRIGLEFPIYGVQKTNKPVEDDDDVEAKLAQVACSLENGEACMACGS
ncbi:hypothetical protein B296_00051946 [Ensete ventricosum]|uniref:Ribonucleotide reductase large subunit domain-containing protein n=1 Tax=Ensete ventricosum TaxID=4639 RepID=A0A426XDB4_ENSVE|nr:hypothetical protein B296_00051946 [Ensete ventricosum]